VLLLHSDVFPYEPFSLRSILQNSLPDDTSQAPDSTRNAPDDTRAAPDSSSKATDSASDAPDSSSETPGSASSEAPHARAGDVRPCGIAARRWVHCVPGTLPLCLPLAKTIFK